MNQFNTKMPRALPVLAIALAFSGQVSAGELIVNGGFETGTFAGWATGAQAGSSSASFFVATGATSPISGAATAGPAAGTFYAITDQTGPGAYFLTQSVLVPNGILSATLSFDMFVNDQSGAGPLIDPAGLDFTAGPNQHARVDLLVGGAPSLSTAPADILANFYLGIDPLTPPNPYTTHVFDVTALLQGQAGNTIDLRFAEVDNQFFFQQGVDNVSLNVTFIPEPSTLVLGLTGLLGVGGAAWHRRRRRSSAEATTKKNA